MSTTPVPKNPKPTFSDLDKERQSKREQEEADRQSRIRAEQERQAALKDKPVDLQDKKKDEKTPLEVAQDLAERRKKESQSQSNVSDAEWKARNDAKQREIDAAKKALEDRQREFEERKNKGWVSDSEETQFEIDQKAREQELEQRQNDFDEQRAAEEQRRKEAAGKSAAQQEQRRRELEQRERERREREQKEKERREKEKQDWEEWNNDNKKDEQIENEYPVEFDVQSPDFADMNLSQYNPGAKVIATRPECEELARQVNSNVDVYLSASRDFASYSANLLAAYEKFNDAKENGKAAWRQYIQALKAMKALLEACRKLNKCADTDVQANLERYTKEAQSLWNTVKTYIQIVKTSLADMSTLYDQLKTAYDTGREAGFLVREQLKPAFIRCESSTGSVKVSITDPPDTSDETGTGSTSGGTDVAQGTGDGTGDGAGDDASGASGASEASGSSGVVT